jgi:hypothetical protein
MILVFFLFSILSASSVNAHTISVPSNTYFGFCTGHYIHFSTAKTFDSIYRDSSDIWHFDNYLLSVENGDMTVLKLMESNIIQVQISASIGIVSTSKIAATAYNIVPTVSHDQGSLSYSYDSITKMVTAQITHASTTILTLDYNIGGLPPTHGTTPTFSITFNTLDTQLSFAKPSTEFFNVQINWNAVFGSSGAYKVTVEDAWFEGDNNQYFTTTDVLPYERTLLSQDISAGQTVQVKATIPSDAIYGDYVAYMKVRVKSEFYSYVQEEVLTGTIHYGITVLPTPFSFLNILIVIVLVALVLVAYAVHKYM